MQRQTEEAERRRRRTETERERESLEKCRSPCPCSPDSPYLSLTQRTSGVNNNNHLSVPGSSNYVSVRQIAAFGLTKANSRGGKKSTNTLIYHSFQVLLLCCFFFFQPVLNSWWCHFLDGGAFSISVSIYSVLLKLSTELIPQKCKEKRGERNKIKE